MKNIAINVVMRTAGSAGGALISVGLDKFVPSTVNPMIKNGGAIVLGAIIPEVFPVKAKAAGEAAGGALAGIHMKEMLTSMFPALAAVSGAEDEPFRVEGPGIIVDEEYENVSGAVLSSPNSVLGTVE